jgi:hypothetical protein
MAVAFTQTFFRNFIRIPDQHNDFMINFLLCQYSTYWLYWISCNTSDVVPEGKAH